VKDSDCRGKCVEGHEPLAKVLEVEGAASKPVLECPVASDDREIAPPRTSNSHAYRDPQFLASRTPSELRFTRTP